jgi:hypothetical protein
MKILPLCIVGCSALLAPVGFLAGRYLAPAREIRTWIPERNSANLESSEAIASLDGFKVEGVMVDRIGPRECVHLHLKSVTPVTPVGGGVAEPVRSVDLIRLFGYFKRDVEGLVGSFKCKSFGSHLEFQDGDLHLHKIIPLRK